MINKTELKDLLPKWWSIVFAQDQYFLVTNMKKKKHNFDHALKFINFYTVIRWLQLKWKNDKLIVDQIQGQA